MIKTRNLCLKGNRLQQVSILLQMARNTADLTNECSINDALRHTTKGSRNPLHSRTSFKFHFSALTLLLNAKDFTRFLETFRKAFVLAFAQLHLTINTARLLCNQLFIKITSISFEHLNFTSEKCEGWHMHVYFIEQKADSKQVLTLNENKAKRSEINTFSQSWASGELQAVHSMRELGSRKCPCVDSWIRDWRLNGKECSISDNVTHYLLS